MTAHQMVCHLADACRMFMGTTTVDRRANLAERSVLKWLALWAPVPWPHGFRTVPEIDQEANGTPPSVFEGDREELLTLMSRMIEKPRPFAWQTHPHFGDLSEREWMRLAYLHTDHHLRQFGC